MESIIERRRKMRETILKIAKQFVKCAWKHLNVVEAYLIGSYARGDFNAWSDIDIVIIAENIPESPIKRLDLVKECLSKFPDVEPIIISHAHYEKLKIKRNPIILEIETHGVKLI